MKFPRSVVGAVVIAGALAAATGLGAVGCGESTEDTPDPDGGAIVGDGGGVIEGDEGGHGDPRLDAGCPVKKIGPKSGTVAVSVARAGAAPGNPWTTPENGIEEDGKLARSTVAPDKLTELLRVTGFGFSLPATAKVKGVEVQLKRQAPTAGVVDGNIQLYLDGTPSDRPKYIASGWPRVIIGTHHYGQAVDTWGNDLDPELVGRPGFGVEIFAKRQEDAGTGAVEATIESMKISLFYCD